MKKLLFYLTSIIGALTAFATLNSSSIDANANLANSQSVELYSNLGSIATSTKITSSGYGVYISTYEISFTITEAQRNSYFIISILDEYLIYSSSGDHTYFSSDNTSFYSGSGCEVLSSELYFGEKNFRKCFLKTGDLDNVCVKLNLSGTSSKYTTLTMDTYTVDAVEVEWEPADGPTFTTESATKVVYASEAHSLTEVLEGITAWDDEDGDLTDRIEITDDGDYTPGAVGTYYVTISVTDDSGNTAKSIINVIVIDDHAPIITGTKSYTTSTTSSLNINTITGTLSAVDFLGNDITSSIKLVDDTYTPNSTTVDTYEIKYSVSDSRGETTEYIVEVKVIDLNAPVFLYDESFTIYVTKGTVLSDTIYDVLLIASNKLQTNTTAIKYDDSSVNYYKTGTYTIDFNEYADTVLINPYGVITVVVTGQAEGAIEAWWLNLKFWFTDYSNQILTGLICGASILVCVVVHVSRHKKPKAKTPATPYPKKRTKGK